MAGINTIIHIPLIGGILNARGRCGQFQSATLENFVVFADLLNTASDGDAGLAGNNDLSGSAFDGRANSLATDFNGNGAASRHGLRRAGGVGQLLTDTLAAAGNAAPSILQSVIRALSKGYFFGIAGLALNGNIPVNGEVNRGIMLDIRNILAVNLCLDSGRTSDAVSDIGSSDGDLDRLALRAGNGICNRILCGFIVNIDSTRHSNLAGNGCRTSFVGSYFTRFVHRHNSTVAAFPCIGRRRCFHYCAAVRQRLIGNGRH